MQLIITHLKDQDTLLCSQNSGTCKVIKKGGSPYVALLKAKSLVGTENGKHRRHPAQSCTMNMDCTAVNHVVNVQPLSLSCVKRRGRCNLGNNLGNWIT